jgi:hypothetical protein
MAQSPVAHDQHHEHKGCPEGMQGTTHLSLRVLGIPTVGPTGESSRYFCNYVCNSKPCTLLQSEAGIYLEALCEQQAEENECLGNTRSIANERMGRDGRDNIAGPWTIQNPELLGVPNVPSLLLQQPSEQWISLDSNRWPCKSSTLKNSGPKLLEVT